MTKTSAISAMILAEVAKGSTLDQAIDAVLGQGTYTKLAGEVYDALRTEG